MTATIRAAIYTRVSSTGQEDNYSLPTQETACRDFAAKRGWQIVAVYSDVHTRTELWERQQLTALRDAVRRRDVDALICYAIDRLSGDPVHLGVVLSEAEHHGVAVEFVTEPVDDSPEGQLIRFVRGYAAKVEHEKIKERTMRGRIARVESGKPNVGPRPPFGYAWADDRDKDGKPIKVRLIENSETAPVVRRIFRELAGGTSARQVGLRLSAEGIPTPTGKTHWTTATITLLVKHPVYTGNACAGRYRRERVKGHGKGWRYMRRDTSETLLLPGVAPALVSAELAGAAVARLAANKQHSTRNNKHPEASLLRGYVICGYCGCQLRAVTPRAHGTLYRCNQANRDAHGCPGFLLQAHFLDAAVWQGMRERLLNRDLIAAELARLERDDPAGDDLAAVERRAADVARRQRNLMARLADEDDADLAALIRADLAALLSERGRLDSERAVLERQRESWRLAQARLTDLDVWVRAVATNLDDLDYAGKRLAIEACRVQVKVWAKDRTPRWEATMRLGGDTPIALVDTTAHNRIECTY
jgi:site-specific DNA recombinase